MVEWRLGTVGFSYQDWVGPFYPKGLKAGEYLAHYAQHFNTVELDTTFYATPPAERVRKWASQVPNGFRFCVKTPRAITHEQTIRGSVKPMLQFLEVMRGLGSKLGAVLLQFPPHFTASETAALRVFLLSLPPDIRIVVEFRHPSWVRRTTGTLLREARCAWVAADYGRTPDPLEATTDFLYMRWIGIHHQFVRHTREQLNLSRRLAMWRSRIEEVQEESGTIYGFFNNDFAGYAVGTAERFTRMIDLPPQGVPPRQGILFA